MDAGSVGAVRYVSQNPPRRGMVMLSQLIAREGWPLRLRGTVYGQSSLQSNRSAPVPAAARGKDLGGSAKADSGHSSPL